MSSTRQQKLRRRLAGYASNDNRIKYDYLKIASLAMLLLAIIVACILWFKAFQPVAKDFQHIIKVPTSSIAKGDYKRIVWEEKPIIIHHRSQSEIDETAAMNWQDMPDPEPISKRSHEPSWIVLHAQCQNLGCQPELAKNHFVCGCDNSFYDSTGRITQGRAHKNIPAIHWKFSDGQRYIIIGEDK
ncbi:MAG: hypothetical protein ACK5MJ_00175 [Alphaproteobacteria bacterium]